MLFIKRFIVRVAVDSQLFIRNDSERSSALLLQVKVPSVGFVIAVVVGGLFVCFEKGSCSRWALNLLRS